MLLPFLLIAITKQFSIIGHRGIIGSFFLNHPLASPYPPPPYDPPPGPILVATPITAVPDVLKLVRKINRQHDLVFIANGDTPYFDNPRHLEHNVSMTNGLLFFGPPSPSNNNHKIVKSPFVPSYVIGRHANFLQSLLHHFELPCQVVTNYTKMDKLRFGKLCWSASMWLLCETYKSNVGEIVTNHERELIELVSEFGGDKNDIDLVLKYSEGSMEQVVPSTKLAIAEFSGRNGHLLRKQTKKEQKFHRELLHRVVELRSILLDYA